MISFEEFQNVDLRVGQITEATAIEDSEKLVLLQVDIGEEVRQIVAGIKPHVDEIESLVGRCVVIVANLEPAELFGYESQGMLLAAKTDDAFALIGPHEEIAAGAQIS